MAQGGFDSPVDNSIPAQTDGITHVNGVVIDGRGPAADLEQARQDAAIVLGGVS